MLIMVEQFEQQFFNPSNPLTSDLFNDKYFMIACILIALIMVVSYLYPSESSNSKDENKDSNNTVKNSNNSTTVESIENNDSNLVSDAIKEALKPTPVVYDIPIISTEQSSDNNGRIKRVTTTVVEYEDAPSQTPKMVRIKCPACGTVNNVPENGTAQCTSCLYNLQSV